MAQVNYTNPEGMYPLQSYNPHGQAIGNGTTPGSLLAGWNLPDRMRDYSTARDLSNQSSLLANQSQEMQNQDYLANSPVRTAQRQGLLTTLGNQAELAPLQQQTAMSDATVNANVAKDTMGTRYSKAVFDHIQGLNTAKQTAALQENLALSRMVKGYATDPNAKPEIVWPMVIHQAKKMGIDTADLEKLDPRAGIDFYQKIDDGHLKNQFDLLMRQKMDEAHMDRTKEETASAERRTRMAVEGKKAVAGVKLSGPQLEAEYYRIGGVPRDERSASEQFMFDNYKEMPQRDPNAKAEANANAQGVIPRKQVEGLKQMQKEEKWAKDYSEVTNYQGKHWGLKKGKAGTQQSDWEKLD